MLALKKWFPIFVLLVFIAVLTGMSMGVWVLKEHVSVVAVKKMYLSRLTFSSTEEECANMSHQLQNFHTSDWGTSWNLARVLKISAQEQASDSISPYEIVPVPIAPTPLHHYPGRVGAFYLLSAYHDSRYMPRLGAPYEDRVIVLVLADRHMREGWSDKNVPDENGWNCLLCSSDRDLDMEATGYRGPPPHMHFQRSGEPLLHCWWGDVPMRSFQWKDIHNMEYSTAQFECKVPAGVPIEKISLTTLGNSRLQKYEKLEDVIFAPLENDLQSGMRNVAVPSFERFKPLQTIKYTTEEQGRLGEAPEAATKPRISLCVGPIFGKAPFLEEWVTFHRLMGVNHFHMYYWDSPVMETCPIMLKTLKFFQKKGFLTLYHVDMLFEDIEKNITGISSWFHAQSTMVMDCYYKASPTADFVGWLDLDEFLAPANATFGDWFEALDPFFKDPTLGSMQFPHWWFNLPSRITDAKWLHTELVTASVFSKDANALGYDDYSHQKCIARVGTVRLQTIHTPHIPVPGFKVENITPDLMFFRHYRNPEKSFRNEVFSNGTEDYTLLRFQELLHLSVKDIKAYVEDITTVDAPNDE